MRLARILLGVAVAAVALAAAAGRGDAGGLGDADAAVATATATAKMNPVAWFVSKMLDPYTQKELRLTNPHEDLVILNTLEYFGTFLNSAMTTVYEPDKHMDSENVMVGCPGAPVDDQDKHDQTSQNADIKGGFYSVLSNQRLQVAVMVFRGTDDLTDVKLDLSFIVTPKFELAKDWKEAVGEEGRLEGKCGKVHGGFNQQWLALRESVDARAAKWVMQLKAGAAQGMRHLELQTIIITGHSLGGAVASLAAAYISSKYPELRPKLRLVVFGCPRTGSEEHVKCVNELVPHSLRIENRRDPITGVPPWWSAPGRVVMQMPCDKKFFVTCHLGGTYRANFQEHMGVADFHETDVCMRPRGFFRTRAGNYEQKDRLSDPRLEKFEKIPEGKEAAGFTQEELDLIAYHVEKRNDAELKEQRRRLLKQQWNEFAAREADQKFRQRNRGVQPGDKATGENVHGTSAAHYAAKAAEAARNERLEKKFGPEVHDRKGAKGALNP